MNLKKKKKLITLGQKVKRKKTHWQYIRNEIMIMTKMINFKKKIKSSRKT